VIELRVHASIRDIPEETWNGLGGVSEAPFLSWAFLDTLEKTGCVRPEAGWYPHHLSLHIGDRLVAAAPAYIKGNSEGEFVFDHGWASAAHRAGIRYYPKLLVAVPFTPATAPRLLIAPGEDPAPLAAAFAGGLQQLVDKLGVSSAHVLFAPEDQTRALAGAGLVERYGLQFQWKNAGYATFDDFLARFSSKRRNQIKRERREMESLGISIETLSGTDLTPPLVDAMYTFYLTTVDKFSWGRRYLNRAFFEEIVTRVPSGIEFVIAREAGRPIAGAFNIAGPHALYGRYWGATQERPFLHFNVCFYHSIEQAIARKLSRFEPGAGGEHKLTRGFEPTITHSLHHLQDRRLDAAVRDYLDREREAMRAEAANPEVAFR
jgi:hypothetical protein